MIYSYPSLRVFINEYFSLLKSAFDKIERDEIKILENLIHEGYSDDNSLDDILNSLDKQHKFLCRTKILFNKLRQLQITRLEKVAKAFDEGLNYRNDPDLDDKIFFILNNLVERKEYIIRRLSLA